MRPTAGQSPGLQPGEVFAGFTILRLLGAGGMGEVYLAQHPRLPRRDALKILPTEYTANSEFRQRFNREADLAASLYNEHIVGIHDRGEYEGRLWISMDYVEGTDAGALLHNQYPNRMPLDDVVQIVTAVADALDYAHSRGLLHRDVKPANILLGNGNPRRRILLADFGIARELGQSSGLTATNMTMGTTAYCAPEQLQGLDLDGRVDQYALGCTAFQLLTGAAPFQNDNPAVIITQHLSAPPPLVSARRPELGYLDGVITRALAKDRLARFATCAEFASALSGQPQAGFAPGAMTMPAPSMIAPPPHRSNRTLTVIASLVAAALVVAAVVVGVLALRDQPAKQSASQSSQPSSSPATSRTPHQTPSASGLKLQHQVTDDADALDRIGHVEVERTVRKLLDERGTKLWVVYVKDFGGHLAPRWAKETMRANGFTDHDALLAIATTEDRFAFDVPRTIVETGRIDVDQIREERIRPAVMRHEWAHAAVAAANGLDVAPPKPR